ncbi:MAG: hypothetical protein WCR46_05045 [Deltaproteobacteria bacterium]
MATRDIAPQANNEGSIGTAAKKWANVQSVLTNDLTLAKQATGFTIAGGTTSKTLTVPLDASVSGTNTGDQTGGTPALTLGVANTAGTSTNFIRRDDTILAFDANNPAALGTAGPGSATVAARRDHVHTNPTLATVLTGYTSGAGTVASTDSVLQAIQKLNGNFEAGNLAYGVKWNTANSSPTLTKGIVVGGGVWIETAYSSFPIQEQMKRCVLNATKAKVYDLDPTDSINKINVAPTITGAATSTTANKLVASAETFSTKGVVAGQWVKNVTTGKRSMITAVDSNTALSVNDDIFVSGNAYSVGTANPKVDGAVFTEVPAFHYVWTEDGTNTYIIISQSPFVFRKPSAGTLVESVVHPWFNEGGVYSTAKYFSSFESVWYDTSASAYLSHDGATICAADDKAVSLPGYTPLTCQYRGTTSPNYRTLHTNFGANFHSNGFYGYEAIWILMTTEFASLNVQTYLPGFTAASGWSYAYCRKTGRTMGLGNASGSVVVDLAGLDSVLSGILTAGLYVANSYRGIENIYGHIWKWVDGANFNWIATGGKAWLSNNPAQWAEGTSTNYEDTGYQLPLSNGYTSALFPGRLLPKLIAGDSATYLCDYFYQPGASAGWRGLVSGGALNSGVIAGPAHLDATDSGSGSRDAIIGGRSAA